MKNLFWLFVAVMLVACNKNTVKEETSMFNYPETKKTDHIDTYFGIEVKDPYAWLENDTAAEVEAWVKEENKVTEAYLSQIPYRDQIKKRLTELWNYPKYGLPFKEGDYYFFFKNDGLQAQSVLYIQKGLDVEPELFLDPNKLSDDGTVSLSTYNVSRDGKYFAYGISRSGSDWNEFFVMDIESRQLLNDHLKWIKFSGISWYHNGFYYSRYDEPESGKALSGKNEFGKVYYHLVGTDQSEDQLVFSDQEHPLRSHNVMVTKDERFLLLTGHESTSGNSLSFKNLEAGDRSFTTIAESFDNEYDVIGNIGDTLYIRTNYGADNFRLVAINTREFKNSLNEGGKPKFMQDNKRVGRSMQKVKARALSNSQSSEKNESTVRGDQNMKESFTLKDLWKNNVMEIIPEKEEPLQSAAFAGDKILVEYMKDVASKAYAFEFNGNFAYEINLPSLGSLSGFSAEKDDSIAFYSFTSFTYPSTIFKLDVSQNKSEVYKKSAIDFKVDDFVTNRVFYESKDGTMVPMFITHKKDIELNGQNPTLLYAYGGFNISMTPSFSVANLVFLENGGIYAQANLRGGSEYGEAWHKAGMRENKQNVFDDFISAAEYLIREGYTSSDKLAIRGGSNGGLLVGACMTQKPSLFKVALPAVGVMDMLKFHKFTIGYYWAEEYGSSEDSTQFRYLYAYSPLHNIKEGVEYPATLVTTADHDDRVVPAHSFKFIATLQEKYKGDRPVMIRIEEKAGHGAGKSTEKIIEEYTDIWAFVFKNLGIEPIY